MKRILITGANSYIGTSFENYIKQYPGYQIDVVDMIDRSWDEKEFDGYDVVFHVAGIAHIKETVDNRDMYFKVNRDLAYEAAKKAKRAGISQFVFLSTMSVYGMTTGYISETTECRPKNAYGQSKIEAETLIKKLEDKSFRIAILRPPMVYGKNCKGNYQQLRSFALKFPFFPLYKNKRSMIYVGNLCCFIKKIIDDKKYGLFFPQNADYVCTNDMVRLIARFNKKKIMLTRIFNPAIKVLNFGIVKKVFGTLVYEQPDFVDEYSFEESIYLSESS